MLAVQFQSVQKPVVRDTRDTWQLREDLQKETEIEARLIREIRSNEEKLFSYETERKQSKEQALRNTLEELKEEAGLTDVTGPGVRLYIYPLNEEYLIGNKEISPSSDLLRRLLNEMNMYGAIHTSVGGQRVINTTVIREIAGETKINGRSLNSLPIEIIVVTKDFQSAKELYNRMEVSRIAENFFIDNLTVTVMPPEENITVPAYRDTIQIRNIESVKPDKGGI